jgi:hypothetical protein
MESYDINEAIFLFQASDTAHGVNGRFDELPGGPPAVLSKLWNLYGQNKIGGCTEEGASVPGGPLSVHGVPLGSYHKGRLGKGRLGSYSEGRAGIKICVTNEQILMLPEKDRIPAISLTLVHEAVHALLNAKSGGARLESEVAARRLEIEYHDELSTSKGVFNCFAVTPAAQDDYTKVETPLRSVKTQSKWLAKDQLADYVLGFDSYREYINDPEWIVKNIRTIWGGINNRWATTKGLSIRALISDDRAQADIGSEKGVSADRQALILEIMESIKQKAHWDEMMRSAGQDRSAVSAPAYSLQSALVSVNPVFTQRIRKLEATWGTNLTKEPQGPPGDFPMPDPRVRMA